MQVSIRSSHTHSHHQHRRSPNMFFIFVLFVAAVLGTQTVAFIALINSFRQRQPEPKPSSSISTRLSANKTHESQTCTDAEAYQARPSCTL